MTTLLRTSLGIHAARIALRLESGEKAPKPEWQDSLFHPLPTAIRDWRWSRRSSGVARPAPAGLDIAGLSEDDPWKELLKIADPVERAAVASKTGFPLTEADLSSVILEAVASRPTEAQRARFRWCSTSRCAPPGASPPRPRRRSQASFRVFFVHSRRLTRSTGRNCKTAGKSPCYAVVWRIRLATTTPQSPNAFLPGGYAAITPQELHAESARSGTLRGNDCQRKKPIVSMLLHNMSAPPRTEARARSAVSRTELSSFPSSAP